MNYVTCKLNSMSPRKVIVILIIANFPHILFLGISAYGHIAIINIFDFSMSKFVLTLILILIQYCLTSVYTFFSFN